MQYPIIISNWQEAILAAATNVLTNIISFLPALLGGILLLAIGLIIARWTKILVIKALGIIRLSQLVKNSAIEQFLNQTEIGVKIEEVIGEIIRWLIILVFFIAAVNVLGLTTVSIFLNSILTYIPRVIASALVLAAGVLVAGLVESLVKGAVSSINISTGRLLGKIASYVIVIFTSMAAIAELGIAQQFINTLFIGFVAMLALALGLAFGLGTKDVIAKMMADWYQQLQKELKK